MMKGTIHLRAIEWLELSYRQIRASCFSERKDLDSRYAEHDGWARSTCFIAFSVVFHWEMRPRTGRTLLLLQEVSQVDLRVVTPPWCRHRALNRVGAGS